MTDALTLHHALIFPVMILGFGMVIMVIAGIRDVIAGIREYYSKKTPPPFNGE